MSPCKIDNVKKIVTKEYETQKFKIIFFKLICLKVNPQNNGQSLIDDCAKM